MDHKIYTGNHASGNVSVPFGKCSCGAYLQGQQEIEAHGRDDD